MFLCENHLKIWTFKTSLLKSEILFQKTRLSLLVETTKIESASFPNKTAMSEANVSPIQDVGQKGPPYTTSLPWM